MKISNFLKIGLLLGTLGYVLARRRQKQQAETQIWQQTLHLSPEMLACPTCHLPLNSISLPVAKGYFCTACQKAYPVVGDITQFIAPQDLTGMDRRAALMYDWFSWGYRAFSAIAFAYIGMNEEQARREITDRLEPKGGAVLEVSIGPGVNLPYLVGRPDVGALVGLDISAGQLLRCRSFAAHHGIPVQLHLANAEQLPYQDHVFGGVFHIGGINFFNDKKKAIDEMIRVAKPGARILISDETEKGALAYEKFLPRFKSTIGRNRPVITAPIDLVPGDMQEKRVFDAWNGYLYCIEFKKPE